METYNSGMARHFNLRLAERLAELRKILHDDEGTARSEDSHAVTDFKEIAGIESLGAVDDVQAAHAAHELEEVVAALRRLADNSYGLCRQCGEPIDLRRLEAVPTAAYCTGCQRLLEQHVKAPA